MVFLRHQQHDILFFRGIDAQFDAFGNFGVQRFGELGQVGVALELRPHEKPARRADVLVILNDVLLVLEQHAGYEVNESLMVGAVH